MKKITQRQRIYSLTGIAFSLMLLTFSSAFAYHWPGYKWTSSTVSLCYSSTLGNLNIGATAASGEVTQGRISWNNLPSVFTLSRTTGCDPVLGNWVDARDITKMGLTSINLSGSTITRAVTTFDTSVNWTTSPSCIATLPTLDYAARHEFGHWVFFSDVFDSTKNTVMWWDYNCNKYDTVKADDSNELTQIYG